MLAFMALEMLNPVCGGMLVAHLCQCALCVIAVVCADVNVPPHPPKKHILFSLHECVCVFVWVCCGGGSGGGADGLCGSPGPGGTALVNNSDEAHYQGSADFSLIPP